MLEMTQGGGFPKYGGYPNSWLVYNRKCHLEMDDDWGYPYDFGNHHVAQDQETWRRQQPNLLVNMDETRKIDFVGWNMPKNDFWPFEKPKMFDYYHK